jgi:cytochrome c peroxidase
MTNKELNKFLAGLTLAFLLAVTGLIDIGYIHAAQTQEGDVEHGKMLFNDPMLSGSTNEKSCNSCHPDGKGLENAQGNIAGTVNKCIKGALAGEPLDVDSQDMKDIVAYIRSLKR